MQKMMHGETKVTVCYMRCGLFKGICNYLTCENKLNLIICECPCDNAASISIFSMSSKGTPQCINYS